jgi:hypothetical protein
MEELPLNGFKIAGSFMSMNLINTPRQAVSP